MSQGRTHYNSERTRDTGWNHKISVSYSNVGRYYIWACRKSASNNAMRLQIWYRAVNVNDDGTQSVRKSDYVGSIYGNIKWLHMVYMRADS